MHKVRSEIEKFNAMADAADAALAAANEPESQNLSDEAAVVFARQQAQEASRRMWGRLD